MGARSYHFDTPVGSCTVSLMDGPVDAPWGTLPLSRYVVRIPGLVEPIDGERPLSSTGRAGARALLAHVARLLGMAELEQWAERPPI